MMNNSRSVSFPETFNEAVSYIEGFINFEKIRHPPRGLMKLKRVRKLLAALGNPQKQYKTIHLAGTKGKGSTAAFCQSVLLRAGFRTGLFTSPHLHDFTERIRIDRQNIPKKSFTEIVQKIHGIIETWPDRDKLSFFEILTAIAFVHFAARGVEVAVIEAGLGGSLDATNVLEPGMTILTPVSLDHTAILGSTISQIAMDKAGIIKPGCSVVLCRQKPGAKKVFLNRCRRHNVKVLNCPQQWEAENIQTDINGTTFDYSEGSFLLGGLHTALCGAHQAQNAAAALAAVRLLIPGLKDDTMRKGINTCRWPGRLQRFPGNPDIWIDGAHNRASARIIRSFAEKHLGLKIVLVFGVSTGKAAYAMLDVFKPMVHHIVCTRAQNPRSRKPEDLARLASKRNLDSSTAANIQTAIDRALEISGSSIPILVCGSLFLAAEAISLLSGDRPEITLP